MRKIDLQDIGILACPGGIHFAEEVIGHLRSIASRKVSSQLQSLSKKYSIPEKDLLQKYSLNRDLFTIQDASPHHNGSKLIPDFRIHASFTRFANGEFKTAIKSSIRGKDIYIFQDVANHYPITFSDSQSSHFLTVNDHFFCLLTTVDAALQAGAARVTVVVPTYPYSRQHKKKGREGLTAARFGQILEYMGVNRIITLDIHSREIENCFNHLRLENLHASYQVLRALSTVVDLKDDSLAIVSPDTGSVERNKFYASALNRPLAMLYKERDYSKVTLNAKDSNITNVHLLGSVENKTVFMGDDILGSGGTLLKAMEKLKERGAKKIICAVSLPFFTGDAIDHYEEAYRKKLFDTIIGTNAVFHDERLHLREWYLSANVSRLFAKTIFRLSFNLSLSPLLDNRDIIKRLLRDKQKQRK
ncbi:MAG: ribose-phosphate diphosphokinase [Spirochaetales bacterium]|nr:ribose-phosphate diphosphokinase [Spirochaetales bacterium]